MQKEGGCATILDIYMFIREGAARRYIIKTMEKARTSQSDASRDAWEKGGDIPVANARYHARNGSTALTASCLASHPTISEDKIGEILVEAYVGEAGRLRSEYANIVLPEERKKLSKDARESERIARKLTRAVYRLQRA